MAKKKKSTGGKIIGIIVILVCIGGIITLAIFGRSGSRVSNPAGALGNTGGNINNEGLFVEDGDTVYFSNPLDNNFIYSMKADGSDQKLVQGVSAKYLNSAGDYLYYNQTGSGDNSYGFVGNMNGIYRLKKGKKGNTKGLDRTTAGQLILIGNDVYYQHYDNTNGMTLYQCSVNGGDRTEVLKEIVNLSCIIGDTIFYPDQNNKFYVNSLDTETLNATPALSVRMYNPVYSDGYIYYISIDDNYCLYRYSINNRNEEKLTQERVDCFNILGGVIFYQRNSKTEPCLIRMAADGSSASTVAMGNYTNINMTSTYTYYHTYGDPKDMYRVSTTGSPSPSRFTPEVIVQHKDKFQLGGGDK